MLDCASVPGKKGSRRPPWYFVLGRPTGLPSQKKDTLFCRVQVSLDDTLNLPFLPT